MFIFYQHPVHCLTSLIRISISFAMRVRFALLFYFSEYILSVTVRKRVSEPLLLCVCREWYSWHFPKLRQDSQWQLPLWSWKRQTLSLKLEKHLWVIIWQSLFYDNHDCFFSVSIYSFSCSQTCYVYLFQGQDFSPLNLINVQAFA